MEAMEQLEGREMFSAGGTTVTLTRADGAARSIVGRRDTWIVIHGLAGTKDDAPMKELAHAVDGMSSRDQVLMVDWRQLAKPVVNQQQQQAMAEDAATQLVGLIRRIGLPASRTNLIGYSMGAFVAERAATALHDTGGVNRLVGLDPAAPWSRLNRHHHAAPAAVNLSANSAYAIAFHGVDVHSPLLAAMSADDTVRVDNIGSTDAQRHAGVLDIFTTMTERNNRRRPDAVSRVFSITQITRGNMPGWRRDAVGTAAGDGEGYEAVVTARTAGGSVAPAMLTYLNRRGHTMHIS
jgi:pimeloyl-ACP methyl ester carboxylesterase